MDEKLGLLEEKVQQVLAALERLRTDNESLRQDKDQLRGELADVQKQFRDLKLEQADQAEVVRSKLKTMLARLEELEGMHQ